MICENCGYENRQGIDFCEECGEKLNLESLMEMPTNSTECKNCGYVNRPEVTFCEECGVKLIVSPEPEKIATEQISIKPKPKQKKSITCLNCGFENRTEVTFCEECGSKLAFSHEPEKIIIEQISIKPKPKQKKSIICLNCGFENRSEFTFCEECGEKLTSHLPPEEMHPRVKKVPIIKKSKKTIICPECRQKNRETVVFCEECGADLSLPHPKKSKILAGVKKFFISLSSRVQVIKNSIGKNPFRVAFYMLAIVCLIIVLVITMQVIMVHYTRSSARRLADTIVYSMYPEMSNIEPQVDHYKENDFNFSTYSYTKNVTGHIQGSTDVEFTVNIIININRTLGTFEFLSTY